MLYLRVGLFDYVVSFDQAYFALLHQICNDHCCTSTDSSFAVNQNICLLSALVDKLETFLEMLSDIVSFFILRVDVTV